MKLRPALLLLLLAVATALPGQELDYRQGELILQFTQEQDGKDWIGRRAELDGWQPLGRSFGTYLVRFDYTAHAEDELRDRYRRLPGVTNVQLNRRVTYRRFPDDPRYPEQWQMRNSGQIGGITGADYNVEAAWEITTGGITPNGDTIVIASLDNGVDLDHEDLQRNLWINRDEIAGNNLDDDNNGYVDDRFGWNTEDETNDIEAGLGFHGTPVMGQIGADGNNGIGVTGVNWSVKVMNVNNDFNFFESEVIQAYSYVLEARQRYDATDGREGAYVVATNASWGRELAFPSESPIWCPLYDTLGRYGILSVAAIPNKDVDVDVVGDLPALCGSDYLIVVTSLNTNDRKVPAAARGPRSVDLAAYGQRVYTTLLGNTYGYESGTSFAAPAVTGAIGLLHAAPCENFGQLAASDPAAAADYLRDILFTTVRPNATLADITVTGGGMDIGAAMLELMRRCDDCLAPTGFTATRPDGDTDALILDWRAIEAVNAVTLRYRPRGSATWAELTGVTAPFRLTGLTACSTYELQLIGNCNGGQGLTAIVEAETRGCCRLPDDLRAEPLSGARIEVSWTPRLAAVGYRLRYRGGDNPEWQELRVTASRARLTGLENCETYEIELATDCDTLLTDFQGRQVVQTGGCGTCLDADYCAPRDLVNFREWIAEVNLPGVLRNTSGPEPDGYTNFGDLATGVVVPGGVYPISIQPEFLGTRFTEDFRIWVDWNQDGFLSSREIAAAAKNTPGGPATATITVPTNAQPGLTRMRIIMEFPVVRGISCPDGNSPGESEDYCLRVVPASGCPPPAYLAAEYLEAEEMTRLSWGASAAPGGSYLLRYRERSVTEFTEREVEDVELRVASINLCGSYEVQVASVCDGNPGRFRRVFFGDNCVATRQPSLPADAWSVAPNPASTFAAVRWVNGVQPVAVELFGADGRRLFQLTPDATTDQLALDVSQLAAGVYLLRLVDRRGRSGVRRLVVD